MKLHLRVISGLQIGDQLGLDPPGGVIGRADTCALHLRDDSVSRSHLELRYQHDGWWAYQQSTRSPSVLDGVTLGSSPLGLGAKGILQVGGVALEYSNQAACAQVVATPAPSAQRAPSTMINVRRQVSTIAHAVLPQLTPLRAAEASDSEAPATLVLHRLPVADLAAESPPTLIRRPSSAPPPIPPAALKLPVPSPNAPPELEELVRLKEERDQLRQERDQLAGELRRQAQELESLKDSCSARSAHTPMALEGLRLLRPFSESLELAAEALQQGDGARAQVLIREASFGLADLRDLFEA